MRTDKLCYLCTLFCTIQLVCQPAAGDSYEQGMEQTLAARVEQGVPLWLDETGDRFLGIFLQPWTGRALGGVIIVHGMGGHPDWPEVVAPLRLKLPADGWATLSIQMPVLEPGEALADYGDTIRQANNRIRTAVRYLREMKLLNIALVGYGFGATTGACYLAEGNSDIQAFIGIGMQSYDFLNPRLNLDACLAQIDIPVLDVYASRDIDTVLRLAANRRLEARRRGKEQYLQVGVDGADHYFSGLEDVMIDHIRNWLDRVAPSVSEFVEEVPANSINPDNQEQQPEQ